MLKKEREQIDPKGSYPWLDSSDERKYMTDQEILEKFIDLNTLNSAYNKVAFNKKSAITKENLCTKYTPFTYKYITLNEKPPIMKQNLHIFFPL